MKKKKPTQRNHNPSSFSCSTQCEEIKIILRICFWVGFFSTQSHYQRLGWAFMTTKVKSMHSSYMCETVLNMGAFSAWCNCLDTVSSTKYTLFSSCFHLFSLCLFIGKNDISLYRNFPFSDIFVFPLNLLLRSQCCTSAVNKAAM